MVHIQALLECGIRQRTRDYITILSNTGLRIGEVVKIKHTDYDWHTDSFHSVRKGGFVQTIHAREAVRKIIARGADNGSEWLFPTSYRNSQFPQGGGHVLMKSASDSISRAMRRIGINDKRITTHSIRHFYACILLAQGVPVHIVQQLMGHASLATTQLYIKINDNEVREAQNLLPYIGEGMTEIFDF